MRPGDRLRRFHEAARQPSRPAATRPPAEEVRLRVRLLLEEAIEAVEALIGPGGKDAVEGLEFEAMQLLGALTPGDPETVEGFLAEDDVPEGNLPAVARELADLVFVTYGTAEHYGIDLDKALEIVVDANMRKLPDCPNPDCLRGMVRSVTAGISFEPCGTCGGTGKMPWGDLTAAGKVPKPDGWEGPDLTWALRRVYRQPEDVPEITKQTAVGIDPATGGETLIERTEEE